MANRHFIRVEANLQNLAVIRGFLRLNSVALGLGKDQIGDIVVAVDEAVTNIIMYGYKEEAGIVEVELTRDGNYLVITIRDRATLFNPLEAPEPDTSLPLHERPLGGLGIHLMRKATDKLEYRERERGGNELIMKKHV